MALAETSMSARDLGSIIRDGRRRKGLTQKALADILDKGQPAVCGWERNRARPSTRTLAALSDELAIDLGDLIRAAGEPLEAPRASDDD